MKLLIQKTSSEQAIIYDEVTGRTIAVIYDSKDIPEFLKIAEEL